jgi:threonine synthase
MPWFIECAEETCQARHEREHAAHRCTRCGELLSVRCDFRGLDLPNLRAKWRERIHSTDLLDRSGVWRFRELVDFFDRGQIVSLAEGRTALLEAPHSARWAEVGQLQVKHQGGNPTGSFKDVGMTVAISRAVALGVRVVACASTGNTSSSMAAYAARAGLKAMVFVPTGRVSPAKLAQALDFGASVVEVGDNFDRAFELVRKVGFELGLYLVNSVNPFRIEGQKTLVAELLEQRDWSPPDYIVVPGGNLGNASAIGKGLRELRELGLISQARTPRVAVVQAAGASAFYDMIASGHEKLVPVENPETEATAIRIGHPANWKRARRVIEETHGLCASVTDAEIFDAKRALAADGVGAEPASAATLAGVRKLRCAGHIEPNADVVAVLTGHQLKDTDYIARHAGELEAGRRIQVEAEPDALRKAVDSLLTTSHSMAG